MSGWAAAAQAAMEIGGTAYSNLQAEQASRKGRRFAYHMATHQYQHAVKDMRKAGINPMLAAKLGGNAAPPAPIATGKSASSSVADAYTKGSVAKSQKDLMQAQIQAAESSAALNAANAGKAGQETRLIGINADTAEVQKAAYQALLPLIRGANDWLNSAQKGSGDSGGVLKGIFENLINSAHESLPGTEGRNQRNEQYRRGNSGKGNSTGPGKTKKGYRLKEIQVK